MAMSINKVVLIGNVGTDPEVNVADSGKKTATFTLATTKKWIDKNGDQKENTIWHNIVMFSKLADLSETLIKCGSKLYIEGSINNSKVENAFGEKSFYSQVIGHQFMIL